MVITIDILNLFVNYSNAVMAIANIILIIFIFHQLRDARKPIIITKIISRDKKVTDMPDVLESGNLYLAIINDSKNISKSINIKYNFNFNDRTITVKEKMLSHLNPKEATKIVLKYGAILKKYPELFEETAEGSAIIKTPKEKLSIDLNVTISYNPILRYLFKYELEDNYVIEWGSLKSNPMLRDHPVFDCWNKRNNEFYIYKTSGNEFRRQEGLKNEWWK